MRKRQKTTGKLKAIDLFAGVGGIRMGFEQAFGDAIKTVFASEWDIHAQKTYRANFHDDFEIGGDITATDEKTVPPFDICLAGFPCQAFSLAGRKQGFKDDYKGLSRGTLFFDVVRICARHKPDVIFCENVKGLTIHDRGRTFKVIYGALRELGYTVFHDILNSKDFGTPQNRERIYIVAFRSDLEVERFDFPAPRGETRTIQSILETEPVSVKYYLSDVYLETLRKHRARHEAKGNGFGYEIRSLDGIAAAIVCGGMGRERNLIVDHRISDYTPVTHIKGEINMEDVRKMTPREWARLQGFPDTFKLPLADVHLYKQLGNSVTVPVIKAIAEKIREALGLGRQARRPGNVRARHVLPVKMPDRRRRKQHGHRHKQHRHRPGACHRPGPCRYKRYKRYKRYRRRSKPCR
jgi:DNA (cytosine-5)-methyltransferase 1